MPATCQLGLGDGGGVSRSVGMSAATIVPCHCALPARRVLCGDGGASRSGVRARLVVAVACMCGPTCRRMSCSRSVAAVLRAGGAVPLACEPLARVSDFRGSRPGVVAVATAVAQESGSERLSAAAVLYL